MQDFAAITRDILALEDRFDVASLTYLGQQAWPAIKIRIRKHLLLPKYNEHNRTLEGKTDSPAADWKRYLTATHGLDAIGHAIGDYSARHQEQMSLLDAEDKGAMLLFSRPQQHLSIGGKAVSPYLDSLGDLLRHEGQSCQKIELIHERDTSTYAVDSTMVDHRPYLSSSLHDEQLTDAVESETITDFNALLDVIKSLGMDVFFTHRSMCNILCEIHVLERFFADVLEAVSARSATQVCYHDAIGMGLAAACKQRGVPLFDIQHGSVKNEPAYVTWKAIPEGGWRHLPDIFLTWGDEFADAITSPMPSHSPHRALTTGNLWTGLWQDDAIRDLIPDFDIPFSEDEEGRKDILFTLDPIDDPIPQHVLDAMKQSTTEFRWLLRLHPIWEKDRSRILSILEGAEVSNWEMDEATRLPLFSLMQRAHAHVTCSSSTCYEALAFDLPTAIVHPRGVILHREYLESGVFQHADDAKILLEWLKNPTRKKQQEKNIVMNLAPKEASKRILNVIER